MSDLSVFDFSFIQLCCSPGISYSQSTPAELSTVKVYSLPSAGISTTSIGDTTKEAVAAAWEIFIGFVKSVLSNFTITFVERDSRVVFATIVSTNLPACISDDLTLTQSTLSSITVVQVEVAFTVIFTSSPLALAFTSVGVVVRLGVIASSSLSSEEHEVNIDTDTKVRITYKKYFFNLIFLYFFKEAGFFDKSYSPKNPDNY